MALTGLILIGFLLMHMYGNLKAFLGAESYNHYAEWLKGEILYPLMPKGTFIWVFRAVMVASICLHIWAAWRLTTRAHAQRTTKYQVSKSLQQTYSSRMMRWGGVILAALLVFHLAQFTVQAVHFGFTPGASAYAMVVAEFHLPLMVILYAVWVGVVCIHVRHGFWSAFTTLGANTSPKAREVLNALAWIVAVLLFVGFMAMPVGILAGGIK
jgi:succinate dehydrogenase / fumarate reductase, cytochrome b subunit